MEGSRRPLVAVLMGSDSDLPVMREAEQALAEFGIPFVTRITSAHRALRRTVELVETLEADGVEVFVVGAGLAAHLAGVVAGVSTRPVIGVPLEGGSLRGFDALCSTVQMPSGVPVATMAIGKAGAKNAGILAAEILAVGRPDLRERLRAFKDSLLRAVERKDAELGGGGARSGKERAG
ncbi:MAG: 5-(carboxyamino)imidazole ribonucleotide mutase [Candidatus Eisenbacteria bacterium]|nr:5-(carboxyamino)imidazole ribonucleotide mutase [Candidatus Eisenbacteria bacterium]